MAEVKPLASLSAGLLARKGAASPAMRRQPLAAVGGQPTLPSGAHAFDDCGWNDMGYDVDPAPGQARATLDLRPLLSPAVPAPAAVGEAREAPVVTSLHGAAEIAPPAGDPPVIQDRQRLAAQLAEVQPSEAPTTTVSAPQAEPIPEPEPAPAPAPVPAAGRKSAFTLRLDADRHLRLRLASAVAHRSAQAILTQLLDDYLARDDVRAAITTGAASAAPHQGTV